MRVKDVEHIIMILCILGQLRIHLELLDFGLMKWASRWCPQANDAVVTGVVWKAEAVVHHH